MIWLRCITHLADDSEGALGRQKGLLQQDWLFRQNAPGVTKWASLLSTPACTVRCMNLLKATWSAFCTDNSLFSIPVCGSVISLADRRKHSVLYLLAVWWYGRWGWMKFTEHWLSLPISCSRSSRSECRGRNFLPRTLLKGGWRLRDMCQWMVLTLMTSRADWLKDLFFREKVSTQPSYDRLAEILFLFIGGWKLVNLAKEWMVIDFILSVVVSHIFYFHFPLPAPFCWWKVQFSGAVITFRFFFTRSYCMFAMLTCVLPRLGSGKDSILTFSFCLYFHSTHEVIFMM